MKYKLGILGGMGPLATAVLYRRIIEKTPAASDREHFEMCILDRCRTPDRTEALLWGGADPVPAINDGIADLEKLGCEYFAIPCNTAHAFKDRFVTKTIKFIDMIGETLDYLRASHKGEIICILGTEGTIASRVYERDPETDIRYPSPEIQKRITEIVYRTKAGFNEEETLFSVLRQERESFDVFVFACTELSVYYGKLPASLRGFVVDAMEILTDRIIELGKDNL